MKEFELNRHKIFPKYDFLYFSFFKVVFLFVFFYTYIQTQKHTSQNNKTQSRQKKKKITYANEELTNNVYMVSLRCTYLRDRDAPQVFFTPFNSYLGSLPWQSLPSFIPLFNLLLSLWKLMRISSKLIKFSWNTQTHNAQIKQICDGMK